MSIPAPWTALLLAAACYRVWRLLAEDTLLERPRRYVCRLPREWASGKSIPSAYRTELARFITCPWCLGWWLVLVVWLCWQAWPHGTTVACVPFAISAAVGVAGTLISDDE